MWRNEMDWYRRNEHTIIHRVQPHTLLQKAIQYWHVVTHRLRIQCCLAGDLLPNEIDVFGSLAEFEESEIEILSFPLSFQD